jgi:cephalosporin-C deacetylase
VTGTLRDPRTATIEVERPVDFDDFWAETLRLTEALDPQPQRVPRPDLSAPDVAVSELYYTSFQGVRVAAWCAQPTGPAPERGRPAAVHIPGYISDPGVLKSWARRGYVTVDLAPRGKLRARGAVDPGYPGLLVSHIVDRFTYAYRGFYADIVRGLDVVAGLDEVDASRFGVWGSSQGGGLGIVAAALRPDLVRCLAAGAPYLCGIMDCTRLTRSYPYEEITEFLRVHPDLEPQVRETVAYFDGLNFAPAVQAPTLLHLGMRDDVCPPETGFALHRRLTCPTRLRAFDDCGHDAGLAWVGPEIEQFLDEHLQGGSL